MTTGGGAEWWSFRPASSRGSVARDSAAPVAGEAREPSHRREGLAAPAARRAGARGGEGGEEEEERGGHEPADLVAQPEAAGELHERETAKDHHAEGEEDAQRGRQVDEQPVARLRGSRTGHASPHAGQGHGCPSPLRPKPEPHSTECKARCA